MQNIAQIKYNQQIYTYITIFQFFYIFQLQIQLNYDVIQLYKCYKLNKLHILFL